jgi:tRNA modification GTPase
LESADIVLLVEDLSVWQAGQEGLESELPHGVSCIRVGNKIDLLSPDKRKRMQQDPAKPDVWMSAKNGQGIEDLKARILEMAGATEQVEGGFSARRRHIDALKRAGSHLEAGKARMEESMAGELLAEELRLAQNVLGEITGEILPDDLLGEIFSSFCIGK